jgi:hypothetical protein
MATSTPTDLRAIHRGSAEARVERTLSERHGSAAIDAAIGLREVQANAWRLLHDARRDGRLPVHA